MQLAHHDALGSVDDERPAFRHQRQFADIDFLLAHVEHLLLRALVFLVEDDEPHAQLERHGKGHALLKAFPLVVLRRAERVARELEDRRIVVVGDRKHAGQSRLQPVIFSSFRLDFQLKEFFVGALLDLNEIRNIDAGPNTGKIFPLDELLQSRFGHSPVLHYIWLGLGTRSSRAPADAELETELT